jgi:hypothetical protein
MQTDANTSADAFAAEAGTVPTVVNSGADAPTATQAVTEKVANKFYTDEDLARVRSQEKDKLYPTIEKLKEEVDVLKREREEVLARKDAEAKAEADRAAAEDKARREAEMDSKEFAKTEIQEVREQLERERQERERAFALLEREKTFAEIQAYRRDRVEQERETIIPELIDLISGETPEEIESSIAGLKDRSSRILESAQSAMQAARRDMAGTRVTSPQTGPLDINTGNRQFTAEEISAMPLNEYAKYRQQLLSDKARGSSQGLFG